MPDYKLPYFEKINTKEPEEYYEAEMTYDGRTIELDLNFEEETIARKRLKMVELFLADLHRFDTTALQKITDDYRSGADDTAQEYTAFHLEQLDKATIGKLVENADKTLSSEEQLISVMHLKRVGFYPDASDHFAVFDYTLGEKITDQLIVVNFDEKGMINYITMES